MISSDTDGHASVYALSALFKITDSSTNILHRNQWHSDWNLVIGRGFMLHITI